MRKGRKIKNKAKGMRKRKGEKKNKATATTRARAQHAPKTAIQSANAIFLILRAFSYSTTSNSTTCKLANSTTPRTQRLYTRPIPCIATIKYWILYLPNVAPAKQILQW